MTDAKKDSLRREYQAKINQIPADSKEISCARIQQLIFTIPEFKKANTVSVYVSKENEMGTVGILTSLWREGKKIVLAPRINRDTLEMCQVYSMEDFVDGPFQLKEPSLQRHPFTGDIDVVLVPGIVFDVRGARIGRGGGYYDRFLASGNTCSIALAYGIQISQVVPEFKHDRRMDYIVTEKRILHTGNILVP